MSEPARRWVRLPPRGSTFIADSKFREKGYRDAEIDEFLRRCDLDRSGTVSLDEFLGAFSQFVAKGTLAAGR